MGRRGGVGELEAVRAVVEGDGVGEGLGGVVEGGERGERGRG